MTRLVGSIWNDSQHERVQAFNFHQGNETVETSPLLKMGTNNLSNFPRANEAMVLDESIANGLSTYK